MKKYLKIVYIVLASLFLLFSIGLAIVFQYANNGNFFSFAANDGGDLAIYIVVKSLVSLALVAMVLYHLLGKRQEGVMVVDIIFTVILQFLPLANRGIAQIAVYDSSAVLWAWGLNLGVSLFVIFIYIAIILLVSLTNHRFLMNKEKVKPESEKIVVRNGETALDENGNFVGPKK